MWLRRGGDLTGLNPNDRAKQGTKYHLAMDRDGMPKTCLVTAANFDNTRILERLFSGAFAG
jgi:hypothetical protein